MVASLEPLDEEVVVGASVMAGADVAWGAEVGIAVGTWLADVPQAARISKNGRHKLSIQTGFLASERNILSVILISS